MGHGERLYCIPVDHYLLSHCSLYQLHTGEPLNTSKDVHPLPPVLSFLDVSALETSSSCSAKAHMQYKKISALIFYQWAMETAKILTLMSGVNHLR